MNADVRTSAMPLEKGTFDRNSPIPLYYQLVEHLKSEIETGKYAPQEKFPTERWLASKYNLSSLTVRNALRELVALGLLVREQGRGTFVKPQADWKTEEKKKINYSRIGLVMPWDEKSLFFPMVHGIEEAASISGFQVLLANNQEDPDVEITKMREMVAHGIDGLIWMCPSIGSNKALIKKIIKKIPVVVTVDRDMALDGVELNSVSSDNYGGMKTITSILLQKGRSKIALIHEPNQVSSTLDRIAGFKDGFVDKGVPLPEEWRFTSRKTYVENGRVCAEKILKSKIQYDAICCTTDHAAVGVIQKLKEKNVNVPDEIAVTGFNDAQIASSIEPMLTTIRQDVRLMGSKAVELLLRKLKNLDVEKDVGPEHVAIPVEVIMRESS